MDGWMDRDGTNHFRVESFQPVTTHYSDMAVACHWLTKPIKKTQDKHKKPKLKQTNPGLVTGQEMDWVYLNEKSNFREPCIGARISTLVAYSIYKYR